MRTFDRAILVIYSVILIVGIAYGLTISVISIHLAERAFEKETMGALASVFALGIVLMSIPSGYLNRRFTPKRTLVGCLLGYSLCVLGFPLASHFPGVAVARFFDGAFSVGVWVSCETILLFHATRAHKAFVMSLYAMAIALGYVIGPLIAKKLVPVATTSAAFVGAAILALVAAAIAGIGLPLEQVDDEHADASAKANAKAHGDATADADADAEATPILAILGRIRTSCFATFSYGYFQASVVIFLPLFLIEDKHIDKDKTIYITAFFAAGMLLFSNLAGLAGDKYGHLLVMRILSAIGGATIASFMFVSRFDLMCLGVFIAGATLASISPVSLALQGLVTKPRDLSRANGFYNAFYAAGMLVGPPISSVLFARWGGASMFYHLSSLFFVFSAFTWICAADDPAYRRRRLPVIAPVAEERAPPAA